MRPLEEVKYLNGHLIAPSNVDAVNPSFDVTPNALISAIVTEQGVIQRDGVAERLVEHKNGFR